MFLVGNLYQQPFLRPLQRYIGLSLIWNCPPPSFVGVSAAVLSMLFGLRCRREGEAVGDVSMCRVDVDFTTRTVLLLDQVNGGFSRGVRHRVGTTKGREPVEGQFAV